MRVCSAPPTASEDTRTHRHVAETPPRPPLKFRGRHQTPGIQQQRRAASLAPSAPAPLEWAQVTHALTLSPCRQSWPSPWLRPRGRNSQKLNVPGWRAIFPVLSLPCLKETGWAMGLLGPSQSYLPLLLHRTGAGHPQPNGAYGHGPPPSSLRPLYVRAGREWGSQMWHLAPTRTFLNLRGGGVCQGPFFT